MLNSGNLRKKQARNAFFEQALREEKKRNYKDALNFYKLALKIDTTFFDAWLNSGAVYSRIGKTDKAIFCYKRAANSKPDKRAFYNLSVEYFKSNLLKECQESLEKALKEDDMFFQAYLLLGYTYGKLSQNEKSEESIKKALKINPDSKPALTALALLYFHTKRYELSLKYVQRLITNSPKDGLLKKLYARLKLIEGDLGDSIEAYKEIAENDPALREMYQELEKEQSLLQKQKVIIKKRMYERKTDKKPKDWLDLSVLSFFNGEPASAMDYLLKAREANSTGNI
ncbi:MAG: tetratricopeptide repeat protein [Spirochaetia bacterium]|nr:tetratricopeptide repeat protein [Spirochaetia bacterium]